MNHRVPAKAETSAARGAVVALAGMLLAGLDTPACSSGSGDDAGGDEALDDGTDCTPGAAGACGSEPRMDCVEFALGNACDIQCSGTCDCPVEAPVCHAAPAAGGGDVWVCGT